LTAGTSETIARSSRQGENAMLQRLLRSVGLAATLAVSATLVTPTASAQADQQQLVDKAAASLATFMKDPEMKWLQQNIGRAKGILIAPEVLKAGFIFGGSGGMAVLVARDPKSGRWVGPAFYGLATASVGFQAGVAVSEVVTLVMTDKGMNSLLTPSVKLGGDASVAAGPVGVGAAGDITTDLVAFSRAKGIYGGVNLDGTVVNTADDWNQKYYGKKVQSPDILVRQEVSSKGGDRLRNEVAGFTKK
jgi:SH3 domain-containing YSC84-like protein 1